MKTNRNQVVLPINLGIKIGNDEPVRKVVEICEELDYRKLYEAYGRKWRQIEPETMFIILVFAYMNRIYSSRDIEDACKHDIRFMWILQNRSAPDHSTIARFQNERLNSAIEDLFYQFVLKLYDMGEIGFENVFIDGTKIEADANRYTFVWAKGVEKNLQKLEHKIERELPEISLKYGIEPSVGYECVLQYLMDYAQMLGIKFVTGPGKRKSELQKDCETLLAYKERAEKYKESLKICGKRKSYSKTDHDATFMRMKEDHMKNGQLKPGYNIQIGVESEYIVGVGLFPNPTDTTTLIPFLKKMERGTGRRYRKVTADAGYASEENYAYLEEQKQEAFIKPTDYEIRKTKKFKSNIFRVENLVYDEENDRYLCPNRKYLNYKSDRKRTSENGYDTVKKNYVCESCSGCPYRERCYKGSDENRTVSVSQTFARQKKEAAERVSSAEGILLRMNRSIQVEGAFGVIKQDYAFRRFLTRGKRKTETQFLLLAFAYNVQKLWNRQNFNRFHQALFEKDTA